MLRIACSLRFSRQTRLLSFPLCTISFVGHDEAQNPGVETHFECVETPIRGVQTGFGGVETPKKGVQIHVVGLCAK